MTSLPSREITQ